MAAERRSRNVIADVARVVVLPLLRRCRASTKNAAGRRDRRCALRRRRLAAAVGQRTLSAADDVERGRSHADETGEVDEGEASHPRRHAGLGAAVVYVEHEDCHADRHCAERHRRHQVSHCTHTYARARSIQYIGRIDVTESMVTTRAPSCGYNLAKCVELMGEDLPCYSNKNSQFF